MSDYIYSDTLNTLSTLKEGDRLQFGVYPQGADGELLPLWWKVLAVEDGKALLITEVIVDSVRYHNSRAEVTWESCFLRGWLNGGFLEQSFTDSERSRIAETVIETPGNAEWDTAGGNPAKDRIFLLSEEESQRYFRNDADRRAIVSAFARSRGSYASTSGHYGTWRLRTPGAHGHLVLVVSAGGSIDDIGGEVFDRFFGNRPAMWVIL